MIMSQPAGRRFCIYCKTDKEWIWTGERLRDGSKIYVDDNGKRWAGRRCPECEKSRVTEAVRCDRFEKEVVLRELKDAGYKVKSTSLPIVCEKDGDLVTVAIKRAFTDEKQVVIESEGDEDADLVALIFASARLFPRDKWDRVRTASSVFDPKKNPMRGGKTKTTDPK